MDTFKNANILFRESSIKKKRRKFFPKIRKLPRRQRKLIKDSVVAVMIRFPLRERKRGKEEKIKLSPIQSLPKKQ